MTNNLVGYFCDSDGTTILGSDSVIFFDGRWAQSNRDRHAAEHRGRYFAHLRATYDQMTHYVYRGKVRAVAQTIGKGGK